jgi:hypothetical protein
MAFAQGTVTRTPIVVGDDEFLVLRWTDLEAGAATEGSIDKLPKLCRLLMYIASGSASTVTPQWTNVTGATVNTDGYIGVSSATGLGVNAEPNKLMFLPAGTLFYKDQVAASTTTVVHTMVIKAGS